LNLKDVLIAEEQENNNTTEDLENISLIDLIG